VAGELCERTPVAQQRNGREENGGGHERQQDDSEEIGALKDMTEIDVAKRLRYAEHQDQCGPEKHVMTLCHDFPVAENMAAGAGRRHPISAPDSCD